MAEIRFEQVGKNYTSTAPVISEVDLTVNEGEFLVVVGPSGCGKSTLLRMVAGLETITKGRIIIGNQVMNDVPPSQRNVAMIFQNYALYPHLSVEKNIGFGLMLQGRPRSETKAKVKAIAELLEVADLLNRRPKELSGGQRQRVAIGRAIIRDPDVFLMDEPLSNLDARLRVQMRKTLRQLHDRLDVTTIYVTHDQVEAMTLGDRVVVLKPLLESDSRSVQQIAPPGELYSVPTNVFVSVFIGSPPMNMLVATPIPGRAQAEVDGCLLQLSGPLVPNLSGRPVLLGVRPHDLSISDPGEGVIPARVTGLEHLGSETLVQVARTARRDRLNEQVPALADLHLQGLESAGDESLTVVMGPHCGLRMGQDVGLRLEASALHVFDAESGERIVEASARSAPSEWAAALEARQSSAAPQGEDDGGRSGANLDV